MVSSGTVKYTAGEIGRVHVIKDFLPAPDDLVPREDNAKVTLCSRCRGAASIFSSAKPKSAACRISA
jgi:hypothetical protein